MPSATRPPSFTSALRARKKPPAVGYGAKGSVKFDNFQLVPRDEVRPRIWTAPSARATRPHERRKPMQAVTEGDRRKEVRALLWQIQAHPERDWTHARRRLTTLNKLIGPAPKPR
jgi:hypothetical protein